MKYPKAFILNGDTYEFYKEIYKGCFEYRHYYLHNYTQEKRYFKKYIEKGNILFELYQKHLKNEKIYNDIIFID